MAAPWNSLADKPKPACSAGTAGFNPDLAKSFPSGFIPCKLRFPVSRNLPFAQAFNNHRYKA